MNDEFKTLAAFLEENSDDVEGRALLDPPAEVKRQFQNFARGALGETERTRLSQLLKDNPHWISSLAEEARAPRATRSPQQ